MRNALIGMVIALLILACGEKQEGSEQDILGTIDWLVGTWQVEGDSIFEEWNQISPKEFEGRSYRVAGDGDTLMIEYLKLVQWEGELVYLATIPDQNDGRPIAFPLRKRENDRWVFENRQHDFPQRITYICTESKDTCTALISGMDEGEERQYSINMLRYE